MTPCRLNTMDASVVDTPTYTPIPPVDALPREAADVARTECISETRRLRRKAGTGKQVSA